MAPVLLVAGVLACGSQPPAHPTPAATVTPAARAAIACDRLKARAPGIEGCPPAGLALDRPAVSHDPGIGDADAQHMAEGFARSYAVSNWAINQGYPVFLQSPLLTSRDGQATAVSFGDDLRLMARARQLGVRYRVDPALRLAAVSAFAVPAAVATQARSAELVPGQFALALALRGPYAAYIGDQPVTTFPATYAARIVMFGDLRDDPDFGGWMWTWGGYAGCDQPWVEAMCRA